MLDLDVVNIEQKVPLEGRSENFIQGSHVLQKWNKLWVIFWTSVPSVVTF